MQNFKVLASSYSSVCWAEPYLVANPEDRFSHDNEHMGLVVRKPVFGVSDKVRFKPESPQLQRLARKWKFCLYQQRR